VRTWNACGASGFSNAASVLTLVPQFDGITRVSGAVQISGFGGTAGGACYTVATTNALLPLAQWPVIATNRFAADGSFLFTNTADPNAAQQFYRLRLP
jgi:hypothetical protein